MKILSNQAHVSKITESNQATPEQLAALKLNELKYNSETQRDEKPYNKGKNDNTGGVNMSQYVTHEELNHVEDNLRHEIKESKLELTGSIKDTKNELNGSINDLSGKINALVTKIDAQSTTLNWIKNIITAGIVIPLITYVVMFIIKHH